MHPKFALIISASAATALALTVPWFWLGAPVGLALFFASIHHADTRNDAFILGLIFGTVTGGASIWWAWDALPFLWLGYTSVWDGAYVMALIWSLVSLGLGVPLALFGAFLFMFRDTWFIPALMGLLWPIVEWGRMWSFALLAVGENALIGPHFSFAALGYLLVDTSLLPIAHLGGVYTLSLAVALMALVMYCITRTPRLWVWWTSVSFLGLLFMSTYAYTAPALKPQTLALVHSVRHDVGSTPPSYTTILAHIEQADIVVFPEDLYLFDTSTPHDVVRHSAPDTLIAFPYREEGYDGRHRTFIVFANEHGIQSQFQKQFLMPEGEYAPFLSQWIFRLIGDPRVESYFGSVRRLERGTRKSPFTYNGATIRGLMCSDIISPELTLRLDSPMPSVIVNIGDQTWFNTSHLLHERLKQIARVRAVETGSYVIVANRGSPSYAIDPYGTLVTESPWGEEGVLYVDLH